LSLPMAILQRRDAENAAVRRGTRPDTRAPKPRPTVGGLVVAALTASAHILTSLPCLQRAYPAKMNGGRAGSLQCLNEDARVARADDREYEGTGFGLCKLSLGYIPRNYNEVFSAGMVEQRQRALARGHGPGVE